MTVRTKFKLLTSSGHYRDDYCKNYNFDFRSPSFMFPILKMATLRAIKFKSLIVTYDNIIQVAFLYCCKPSKTGT